MGEAGCYASGASSVCIADGETLECFKKGNDVVKFMFWKQYSRMSQIWIWTQSIMDIAMISWLYNCLAGCNQN